MATGEPRQRTVLVTGAEGPLAEAVIRVLKTAQLDVRRATSGDFIPEQMNGVNAVVILDGIWPRLNTARYVTAIRAVTAGLLDTEIDRVVGVGYCPRGAPDRERYLDEATNAERDLSDAVGEQLVLLRSALAVGTPRQPGPSDRFLFKGRNLVLVTPGGGRAPITPVLVEDLAKVIAAALERAEPTGSFDLGGPQKMNVDDLVRRLNGPDLPIRHPPAFLTRRTHLPDADAAIENAARFGTELRPISELWTERAVTARERSSQDRTRTAADRYARTRRAMVASAFFLVIGGAAGVIGLRDLLSVDDVGIAVASVLVALASILLLSAAAGLFHVRWSRRFALGMLAAAVSLFMGVLLLVVQLKSGDPMVWRFIAWIAIVAVSATVFLGLRQRSGVVLSGLHPFRGFGALVGAVGAGTLVSAFAFWYTNFYVPARATPTLSLDVSLTKVAVRDGRTVLAATLTAKNTADIPINVLGSVYQVNASKLTPPVDHDTEGVGVRLFNEQPIRRHAEIAEESLVDTGELVPIGFFMEKNEQVTRRFRVYVKPGTVDVATLRAYIVVSRRKLALAPPLEAEPPSVARGALITTRDLNLDSWLLALIRGDRYLRVEQSVTSLGDRTGRCRLYPPLKVYLDRHGRTAEYEHGCDAYNDDLAHYYGVAGTSAVAQVDVREAPP